MSYIFISPLVFLISDVIIPMVVDLPAPFGPSKAKKSPALPLDQYHEEPETHWNIFLLNYLLLEPLIHNNMFFSLGDV